MTNAELLAKIKAEIERRKKEIHATVFNDEFDSFLSFLSTLESEKPIGLEEEIKRWWGEEYMKNAEGLPILPVVQGIARHFAEWQSKQDKETIELAEDHAYLAGAVNEREKMMKEAVEGEVESFTDMQSPEVTVPLNPTMFKVGDKVRVIIVKEC